MPTRVLGAVLLASVVAGIKLNSGYDLDVGERSSAPAVNVTPATCYYNGDYSDNVVAATAATTAFATSHHYTAYPGDDVQLFGESLDGLVPAKTFWSASLNDTLTTASAEGLAWAANPANGYVFQRVEGYCSPTPTATCQQELVTMWSNARKDSFLVAKTGEHYNTAVSAGYTTNWTECYGAASSSAGKWTGGTGLWTAWPDQPQSGIPWPKSKDLLGWEYLSGANPGYGGGDHVQRSADTWYPSWSADGNLYTPWTDGNVKDDVTGQHVGSGSGGKGDSLNSTTGQAKIVGDDPFNLTVTDVKVFTSSTYPYKGRYPCGTLCVNDTWFYSTYMLDNPNSSLPNGSNTGPNPGPNCGNWCIQGPVTDFRYSTDNGATWTEPRIRATSPSDNVFGETAAHNAKVKFGAPHFVDFGQNLEHSPDGKAYLVGHGASRPEAIQAWMLGDEVYMARVTPTVEAINDKSQWEFYAGGTGSNAKWVQGDISAAVPLVKWDDHTGVVTMTYFAALKKYILTISTASYYPSMVKQFDTYFLESDSITGPWAYVNYNSEFGPEAYFCHHPSKFLAVEANTTAKVYDAFLMYSANFAFRDGSNPPNSAYHMNLQQARIPLSDAFAARLAVRYAAK